jgi:hypothetical protein
VSYETFWSEFKVGGKNGGGEQNGFATFGGVGGKIREKSQDLT